MKTLLHNGKNLSRSDGKKHILPVTNLRSAIDERNIECRLIKSGKLRNASAK
jgi:hypothetical protein